MGSVRRRLLKRAVYLRADQVDRLVDLSRQSGVPAAEYVRQGIETICRRAAALVAGGDHLPLRTIRAEMTKPT
jgi:hypothetical protein